MTKTLLIPGLPRSLARDGWWLAPSPPDQANNSGSAVARLPRWIGSLALVILADWLFWHQSLGLSLALFAIAIFAVASFGIRPGRALWRPAVLLVLAAAPMVEHLQALSVGFLALGLAGALVWTLRPELSLRETTGGALAFLGRLPGRWIAPLSPRNGQVAQAIREAKEQIAPRKFLRDWAFPLAGGLILAGLMMEANPVLAQALNVDLDLWVMLSRCLFWIAAALFIAPFLSRDLPASITMPGKVTVPMGRLGINAASVLRALVVFNGVIAVQTATDVSILTFGATLPDGMSMAEYAHRGAYPLLVAALLAGAFALASRPFLGEHRATQPLLLLFLLQNMALCGAAMLRLDHYIDGFGLTYLRLYALIWMGLVAVGLGLVAVQVLLKRPNLWLITRCSALGLATLYVSSFLNFAQVIAEQNLARPNFDAEYVCSLGPMAHAAIGPAQVALSVRSLAQVGPCGLLLAPRLEGWRDWGFRSWRVNSYSATMEPREGWE
jgi:Domain of unknown function (DUF4173)